MFHVRATAFAGQVNASRSSEFNTTARSETTTTSSLSTSVSTHISASAPSSKLLGTNAIGMSGRRSSSGGLLLAFTWEGDNAEDENDVEHVSQRDLLTVVVPILEYHCPFGTAAAEPLSQDPDPM
ncbi:hypothetical protein V8E55_006602 [Tylopilus felleus]